MITTFVTNWFIKLKLSDIGGTIVIYAFGAYFGLAVSFVLGRFYSFKSEKESSIYQSDIYAFIGKQAFFICFIVNLKNFIWYAFLIFIAYLNSLKNILLVFCFVF